MKKTILNIASWVLVGMVISESIFYLIAGNWQLGITQLMAGILFTLLILQSYLIDESRDLIAKALNGWKNTLDLMETRIKFKKGKKTK